jgi:hypothetical protein
MGNEVGRLERVPLREVWKHEAHDFTQWLQENLDQLNGAIDLTLVAAEREQPSGAFNIDLVAENEDGTTVIIENQLGKSDHDHLGKLITYLTGVQAKAAVWIVSDPRPEHVAAITWLNEAISADFYMVKLEAVRIGSSPAAALFTLIVGPSAETKEVGHVKKELAERNTIRNRWWTQLIEEAAKVSKLHAHISPGDYHWIGTSTGVRGLGLNYVITEGTRSVELYIDRGKDSDKENKSIFDQLLKHESEIEQSFGGPLIWQRLEGKRACRIRFTRDDGGYRAPDEQWSQLQAATIGDMTKLDTALRPYLSKLKVGAD